MSDHTVADKADEQPTRQAPAPTNGQGTRPITDVPHTDIGQIMAPGTVRRQPLRGFDEDYVDIVDYIVRCTHKIWEEGAVGLIYTHYSQHVVVHTSDGNFYGRETMVEDTLQRLAAFPNLRAFADDVIWSGNEDEGFHSSHRVTNVSRNTGYSAFGPPTGRSIMRRGFAHCLVKENRIVEEWLALDTLSIVRQLGFDEHKLAREAAARAAELGVKPIAPEAHGEIERLRGQLPPEVYPPASDDFDPEDFVRRHFHEVWNWRMLNRIRERCAPNLTAVVPTNRTLYGPGDYKMWVLELLGPFPDALVTVDHVCSLPNGPDGYRVATRWTIQGTHLGPGPYGPPTGKRIRLIGVTHQQIQGGKILKEWTVIDQFALLKQLYAPV